MVLGGSTMALHQRLHQPKTKHDRTNTLELIIDKNTVFQRNMNQHQRILENHNKNTSLPKQSIKQFLPNKLKSQQISPYAIEIKNQQQLHDNRRSVSGGKSQMKVAQNSAQVFSPIVKGSKGLKISGSNRNSRSLANSQNQQREGMQQNEYGSN